MKVFLQNLAALGCFSLSEKAFIIPPYPKASTQEETVVSTKPEKCIYFTFPLKRIIFSWHFNSSVHSFYIFTSTLYCNLVLNTLLGLSD